MNRKEILDEAAKAVTTERQSAYGTPENSFSGIADYWNVYMAQRAEGPFTAHDVGMMLLLMKVRRTAVSPGKADNYVDLAGYGACVGEISTGEVQAELPGMITGNPVHDALLGQMGGLAEAPPTFPDPPAGRKWHNPDKLTAGQVDVDAGWRLTLEDEPLPEDAEHGPPWVRIMRGRIGEPAFTTSYRTKAPLPDESKIIDIPPRQTKDEYGDFLDEPSEPDEKPLTPEGFPDPPAGRKWHNPEGLTAEQVGIADGWRLCLEDEACDLDDQYFTGSEWRDGSKFPDQNYSGCSGSTYRTKAPLPAESQTFPDPPAGRKWHNPEGLTPEQVGIADGWRLCLEDEACDLDDQWFDGDDWHVGIREPQSTYAMTTSTYRTKAPLP